MRIAPVLLAALLATPASPARAELVDAPGAISARGHASAVSFGVDGSFALVRSGTPFDAWEFHGPRGELRWSVAFDVQTQERAVSVARGATCAAYQTQLRGSRVACRDAISGGLLWERELADADLIYGVPAIRRYDDGTTLAVFRVESDGARSRVYHFDASGNELSRFASPSSLLTLTAAGNVLVPGATATPLVRPDGAIVTSFSGEPFIVRGTGDSFASFRGEPANTARIRQYDARGVLLADSIIAGGAEFAVISPGPAGVLLQGRRPTGFGPLHVRFVPVDGSTGWERDLPALGNATARVLADGVAIVSVGQDRVRTQVLASDDGSDRVLTDDACDHCGAMLFTAVDESASVRAIATSTDVRDPFAKTRLVLSATTEPRLAPDPRTVSGAWFPSYLAGEGLVATVDPSSSTLFAAWFTYAAPLVAGEAGLRWYSLQGTADPSGTSQLTVYANRGGAFAQPPVTTAVAIGHATLRLVDCNRAELEYTFDGQPPVNGRRTLTRLTDPGRCGATAPAARAGVDWRQSGAWFEPATAGQGVLFSIAPDAPVFGAWFTYDVAGRGDDPAQQQWLTLQSADVPADAAEIELDVYRTIGGAFDEHPATATFRVGTARLTLDGCSRATLRWQFDASTDAGVLANRAGQQELVRLGACPP